MADGKLHSLQKCNVIFLPAIRRVSQYRNLGMCQPIHTQSLLYLSGIISYSELYIGTMSAPLMQDTGQDASSVGSSLPQSPEMYVSMMSQSLILLPLVYFLFPRSVVMQTPHLQTVFLFRIVLCQAVVLYLVRRNELSCRSLSGIATIL